MTDVEVDCDLGRRFPLANIWILSQVRSLLIGFTVIPIVVRSEDQPISQERIGLIKNSVDLLIEFLIGLELVELLLVEPVSTIGQSRKDWEQLLDIFQSSHMWKISDLGRPRVADCIVEMQTDFSVAVFL